MNPAYELADPDEEGPFDDDGAVSWAEPYINEDGHLESAYEDRYHMEEY